MKRYLLFTFPTYYPGGGWEDLVASFDDLEQAKQAASECKEDHFQIVDTATSQIIAKETWDWVIEYSTPQIPTIQTVERQGQSEEAVRSEFNADNPNLHIVRVYLKVYES